MGVVMSVAHNTLASFSQVRVVPNQIQPKGRLASLMEAMPPINLGIRITVLRVLALSLEC